jgi:transcriptional regulator with GAF, ATPase, and Fis domain
MNGVLLKEQFGKNLLQLWLYVARQTAKGELPPDVLAALKVYLDEPSADNGGLRFSDATPSAKLVAQYLPAGLPQHESYRDFAAGDLTQDSWRLAAELMIGHSPALHDAVETALRLAPTAVPVLIQGETGSGKELMAQLIHRASLRTRGPLVTASCAALPETLLLSELFGYEPGAFTGAARRGSLGKVEAADGGTLFLDEIGELPSAGQAALLRFLDSGEVQKIGRAKSQKVSVRLICATNRDLDSQVQDGAFRADLYYHIALLPVRVPPLREREDDLPLLAEHFLAQCRRRYHRDQPQHISEGVLRRMTDHAWPGNIRELAFIIERAFLFCSTMRIEISDLPAFSQATTSVSAGVENKIVERMKDARATLFRDPQKWARFIAAHARDQIATSDVVREFGMSEASARIRLTSLVTLGVLRSFGEKKGRRYLLLPDYCP